MKKTNEELLNELEDMLFNCGFNEANGMNKLNNPKEIYKAKQEILSRMEK